MFVLNYVATKARAYIYISNLVNKTVIDQVTVNNLPK